jgi:hypothetical protein
LLVELEEQDELLLTKGYYLKKALAAAEQQSLQKAALKAS